MIIYHGSDHIIEKPLYNGSNRTNDYGYGFYTTENIELAKEWACSNNSDGYANEYELDLSGLNILRLNSPDYNILNWLAILTYYRSFWQKSTISEEAKNYLQENFFIDLEPFDVVIGYRADDSYFSFAQDFVANTISLSKLSEAMRLEKHGEQIVLKSRLSFEKIRFIDVHLASAENYFEKKVMRDKGARRSYRENKNIPNVASEIYMIDIIREGIKNGDSRLFR